MRKIELRDYQQECLDTIVETFKTQRKQFIQLPTGSGKTMVFINYIKENSRKALIVCPTVDLKNQIYKELCDQIKDRNIVCADRYQNKKPDVYITTASSLIYDKTTDYLLKMRLDTVIIDEAHHASSNMYKNFIEKLESKNKNFKLLGVTATPERLDGKSILDVFDNFTFQRNIINMIEDGYLCDLLATRIKTNVRLKKTLSGKVKDFTEVDLKELDNELRNQCLVETYQKNCENKKTLIFCLNIEHSILISESLKNLGYKSAYIHGKLSKPERISILKRLKSGEIQVLTNCQVLTEGFDEPSIEAIIIARPTTSKALYCQMIGRGLRLFPGKNYCELYELTDNAHNICTFMVVAGYDNWEHKNQEYEPKTSLLSFQKELINAEEHEIKLSKQQFSIFEKEIAMKGNEPDLLSCKLYGMPQTESIKEKGIDSKYNLLETLFILWKERLKKKYGYN